MWVGLPEDGAGGGGGRSLGGVLTAVSLRNRGGARGGGRVGRRKRENEDEERDVHGDEQESEADCDVTHDQAYQRQVASRLAAPLDLRPCNMARDHGDQAAEAPAADHRRGRKRDADDRPRVVRPRGRSGINRRWGRRRRRLLHAASLCDPGRSYLKSIEWRFPWKTRSSGASRRCRTVLAFTCFATTGARSSMSARRCACATACVLTSRPATRRPPASPSSCAGPRTSSSSLPLMRWRPSCSSAASSRTTGRASTSGSRTTRTTSTSSCPSPRRSRATITR